MKTFEIEIPDGYEIDREASTFEKIVFKKLPRKRLPKTWQELHDVSGWCFNDSNCMCTYHERPTVHDNKNVFVTIEQAEASVALAQLSQLREVYRQGWKPNWCDEGEQKYCIGFQAGSIVATIHIVSCQFLSFQSAKVRDEFFDNFIDLIRDAEPLMS